MEARLFIVGNKKTQKFLTKYDNYVHCTMSHTCNKVNKLKLFVLQV